MRNLGTIKPSGGRNSWFDVGTNWDLDAMMEAHGVESASDLTDLIRRKGFFVSLRDVRALYNGLMSARDDLDNWRSTALVIAEALDCTPETLFDDEHQFGPRKAEEPMDDSSRAKRYPFPSGSDPEIPGATLERHEIDALVRDALCVLAPREERILRLHHGIGGRELNQTEIAEFFGVTHQRIQQLVGRSTTTLGNHPKGRHLCRIMGRAKNESDSDAFLNRKGRTFERKLVPQTDAAKKRIPWPDLRGYGLEMKLLTLPDYRNVLAIRTLEDGKTTSYDASMIRMLGFTDEQDGMLFNREAAFSLDEFVHYLPMTKPIEVSFKTIAQPYGWSPQPLPTPVNPPRHKKSPQNAKRSRSLGWKIRNAIAQAALSGREQSGREVTAPNRPRPRHTRETSAPRKRRRTHPSRPRPAKAGRA